MTLAVDPTIRMLEAEPDLGRFLTADEREQAARIALPVRTLRDEFDSEALLSDARAFGALIVDGMVLRRIQLGEQAALRLLGPGELLSAAPPQSRLVVGSACTAVARTHVAILDDRTLLAAQRWPRLVTALYLKAAEQSERTMLQLAICQLPRVTDRLLALLWLLSESWGRVTSSGVTLPVAITHDALGGMIGARRPTVTLALGELSERGAVVKQDLGWLLIEELSPPGSIDRKSDIPVLLDAQRSPWSAPSAPVPTAAWTHAELLDSVARLRSEHERNRERVRERLAEAARTRDRVRERRERLTDSSSREAPSA